MIYFRSFARRAFYPVINKMSYVRITSDTCAHHRKSPNNAREYSRIIKRDVSPEVTASGKLRYCERDA